MKGKVIALLLVVGLAIASLSACDGVTSGSSSPSGESSASMSEPSLEGSSSSEESVPEEPSSEVESSEDGKEDAPVSADSGADETDVNEIIDDILDEIEDVPGFVEPDSYYQPLVSFTDIDGNGVSELVALYKVKKDGSFQVLYDVYSVKDGSCTALRTGSLLYEEVGGNSGTIGLAVDKAKGTYLKLERREPQGDRFNNYTVYMPWENGQMDFSKFVVTLDAHGVYGEEDEGSYAIDDIPATKKEYEARETEFTNLWTDLDLNMGPGNGGNNMSFSQIRFLDMNTYAFNSVN